MALENGVFQYGSVEFPLTENLTNSSLKDLDPTIYYMLDYFKSMIETYALKRWNKEVVICNLSKYKGKIVNYTMPYNPLPYLQDVQVRLPLLSVYRITEDYTQFTSVKDQVESSLELMYVMPALSAAQMERMNPFLKAIASILVNRTVQGYDSVTGKNPWKDAGLKAISVLSTNYGVSQIDGELYLPTFTMRFNAIEISSKSEEAYEDFEGIDVEIDKILDGNDDETSCYCGWVGDGT